jgi:uncharacterized membrane protein
MEADRQRERRARGIALSIGILLVVLVTAPPFTGDGVRAVLMAAFSGVCHQLPARTPHVDGVPFAVCFRCYGIYWGILLAALLYPVLRRRLGSMDRVAPLVLVGSLVPAGVDWVLELVGLVPGSQAVRVVTGAVFGLAAGYFLVSGIARARGQPREAGA